MRVAQRWPESTVLSLAISDAEAAKHEKSITQRKIKNNVIFSAESAPSGGDCSDKPLCRVRHLAEIQSDSPEFVRFQVLHSMKGGPFLMKQADSNSVMGRKFGAWLSLALTTFVQLPNHDVLSVALTVFGPNRPPVRDHKIVAAASRRRAYRKSTLRLISHLTQSSAVLKSLHMRIEVTDLTGGMVRIDVSRMLRKVGHHFDWTQDGHKRKYDLHVEGRSSNASSSVAATRIPLGCHPNHGNIVEVYLTRAGKVDGLATNNKIPYVTINSLTLIAALRLGIVRSQRSQAYQAFLSMPLYEDMTPWNIAFRGSSVHYIDYDTREKTFNAEVAAIYQSLSVLTNYKRTIQDFSKCGRKGKNGPYNFPYMSDCIGSSFNGPCPEPAAPVPCGNGKCTTDYIACLKSMKQTEMERRLKTRSHATPWPSTPLNDAASGVMDDIEKLLAEGALDFGDVAFE
jgi:hypothetical protein